jgi:predicted porin
MQLQRLLTLTALSGAAFVATLPAQEADNALPSQAEMWQLIQAQQQQIEALTALVQANKQQAQSAAKIATTASATATSAVADLKATQQQVEATTLAVEEIGDSSFGAPGWWENTSVGGYGELHANFPENGANKMDFHRFVLFFNHDYNDWISLYTELELEHSLAGEGKDGEVELEQAFIRMDWTEQFSTDAGLFIMPIGTLNETHEPNTFYGVERNQIEKYIIPTTWWEGGIKGSYRMDNGLAFDGAITSGLDVEEGYIRGGRQKVSNAVNDEAALTGRVKYTGIAGLEVAASVFYQDDLDQTSDGTPDNVDADYSGLLSSAHIDYSNGNFRLRALYARWDLDGEVAADAEEQTGFYIEPSYRWKFSEQYGDLGIYTRYSDLEYFDKDGNANETEILEFGVNYWPTENVVFKADYQNFIDANDAFNLGVGYQF